MGEGRQIRWGLQWSSVTTAVSGISQLALVLIFVQLLSPEAFGIYTLVMIIAGFSQAFSDMGITNAIVFKQEPSPEELSALQWISILMGAILGTCVFLLAPLFASFYGEPVLVPYVRWIGLTFLIQPWGQFNYALLQKNLEFRALAIAEIGGRAAQLLASVLLALGGLGVTAFVVGTVLGIAVQAGLLVLSGRRLFRPFWTWRWSAAGELVTFGVLQMGERVANYFTYQVDLLLVGRFFGAQELGLYNLAKQVAMKPVQLVNPVVTRVMFPLLARHQLDSHRFSQLATRLAHAVAAVNIPVCSLLVVFAAGLVSVVGGEDWLAAAPVLQVLALFSMVRGFLSPSGVIVLAKGKASWSFAYAMTLLVLIPAVIWVGRGEGILVVAALQAAMMLLLLIPNWSVILRRLLDVSWREYHRGPSRILVASMVATGTFWALVGVAPPEVEGGLHLLGIPAWSGVYLLVLRRLEPDLFDRILTALQSRTLRRRGPIAEVRGADAVEDPADLSLAGSSHRSSRRR